MSAHKSHNYDEYGWCMNCKSYVLAMEAAHPCRPACDAPSVEAPKEIDWSKINAEFSKGQ